MLVNSLEDDNTVSPSMINNNTTPTIVVDVTLKGCFCDFDAVACIRNGTLSLFITVTAFICVAKLLRLHLGHHKLYHQYAIFYCALIECLLCTVHWVYAHDYTQIDFSIQYLKLVQFIMVIHFYLSHTARLLKKERLIRRVLEPFLLMNFVYFTVVTIMAIVLTKNSWIECLQPYWLMLSTVEFVVVQVFFVAGIVITRKLNEVRQLDSARNAQKRDLWGLIIVFEVSAFVTLVYDITVSILGTEERGCSDIFNNMQSVYTAVYAFVNIFKIMLPMWAMLCVFHAPSKQENGPNNFSINSDNRSVFQPRSPRHYNRLSYPDLRTAACPQYVNTPRRSQSYATMPSIEEEDTNYLIT